MAKIQPLYNPFYFKFILYQMLVLSTDVYILHDTEWHLADVNQILNQPNFKWSKHDN